MGRCLALVALVLGITACESVDPGPNFVIPNESFNEDYFFCYVEPQYLFAKQCGPGTAGDGNRCHFNASAVSGMALRDHPAVDCDANGHPTTRSQVSTGSLARANFTAASLEMSRDYQTAPILVRPLGANHPRPITGVPENTVKSRMRYALERLQQALSEYEEYAKALK